MKVRTGHVSNSSSSSFIIAFKSKNLSTPKEKTEMLLDILLGGNRGILAEELIRPIAKAIIKNGFREDGIKYFLEEWDSERVWHEENDQEYWESGQEKAVRKAMADGWEVGIGFVSYNESDDPGEIFLGNSHLNIQTDSVILKVFR